MIVSPGATIGIIGGGQLGRMLSVAAAQLGYRCHIFDPHENPCAADVAASHTRADYTDVEALRRFGAGVDIATYEFENLPAGALDVLAEKLRPGTRSLNGMGRAVTCSWRNSIGVRASKGSFPVSSS